VAYAKRAAIYVHAKITAHDGYKPTGSGPINKRGRTIKGLKKVNCAAEVSGRAKAKGPGRSEETAHGADYVAGKPPTVGQPAKPPAPAAQ
jgi:hypothetical protein